MHTILTIDLGKYNTASCHYDPDTKAPRFHTLRTTPDEVRELLGREPVARVVIEVCTGAGWVSDPCQTLGAAAEGPVPADPDGRSIHPPLRRFFETLTATDRPGGLKAKMQAIEACMRKLVMIGYGVWKHRTPFDPNRGSRITG